MPRSKTRFNMHLVTPFSLIVRVKLTGVRLVKEFPAFNGTMRFITAFTADRHLSLSRATTMKKMPLSHFLKTHFNLLTPNDNYSGRTAPLTSKVAFYIFIQQI